MSEWEPGYEESHTQWREEQDLWWQDIEEKETRRLEIEAAAQDEGTERLEAERAKKEKAQ